jgi:hypothetical protein
MLDFEKNSEMLGISRQNFAPKMLGSGISWVKLIFFTTLNGPPLFTLRVFSKLAHTLVQGSFTQHLPIRQARLSIRLQLLRCCTRYIRDSTI